MPIWPRSSERSICCIDTELVVLIGSRCPAGVVDALVEDELVNVCHVGGDGGEMARAVKLDCSHGCEGFGLCSRKLFGRY